MSDLISKSALIEAIKKRMEVHEEDAEKFVDENFQCGIRELLFRLADKGLAIIEMIEEQPTIEPVRGEWIEGDTYYNSCGVRLIDADAERDGFMEMVYEQLSDDPDNIRANLIIDYYDSLPTVELPVRGDLIKSMIEQMEALNAGYMKIGFDEYSVIIADKETTEFIEATMDEEE